jgi:hypothetical protein
VQTSVTPSIVRFSCVPCHAWFANVGGAFTNATIGAPGAAPGAIAKLENVTVYAVPGVTGTDVGTLMKPGTTSDAVVAGETLMFVTVIVCGPAVSSTSSSFAVPGSGSANGKTPAGK